MLTCRHCNAPILVIETPHDPYACDPRSVPAEDVPIGGLGLFEDGEPFWRDRMTPRSKRPVFSLHVCEGFLLEELGF
jgi:hypothetical protein